MFHFIWLRFYLKMSHNIYHMSSRATIPEFQPLGDTKALARYVTLCLRHQVIFWYVTLEGMWYMYNIKLLFSFINYMHAKYFRDGNGDVLLLDEYLFPSLSLDKKNVFLWMLLRFWKGRVKWNMLYGSIAAMTNSY